MIVVCERTGQSVVLLVLSGPAHSSTGGHLGRKSGIASAGLTSLHVDPPPHVSSMPAVSQVIHFPRAEAGMGVGEGMSSR